MSEPKRAEEREAIAQAIEEAGVITEWEGLPAGYNGDGPAFLADLIMALRTEGEPREARAEVAERLHDLAAAAVGYGHPELGVAIAEQADALREPREAEEIERYRNDAQFHYAVNALAVADSPEMVIKILTRLTRPAVSPDVGEALDALSGALEALWDNVGDLANSAVQARVRDALFRATSESPAEGES